MQSNTEFQKVFRALKVTHKDNVKGCEVYQEEERKRERRRGREYRKGMKRGGEEGRRNRTQRKDIP